MAGMDLPLGGQKYIQWLHSDYSHMIINFNLQNENREKE